MFSLEQLLFSVAQDIRTNVEILEVVLPMLKEVYDREMKVRAEIQVSKWRKNYNFLSPAIANLISCNLPIYFLFPF